MKFKLFIITILLCVGSLFAYMYFSTYEGDFYEVCFVYYSEGSTYVTIGNTHIKVSDDYVELSAKNIINDPFNHTIQSPIAHQLPNTYMHESFVSLYDNNGSIYMIDTLNKTVKVYDDIETYQLSKDKEQLLILRDEELILVQVEGFKEVAVLAKDIVSFVADDQFKKIYGLNTKQELLALNQGGLVIDILNNNMKSPILVLMDDYLLFNDETMGYIYHIGLDSMIAEFDAFLYTEDCQFIDDTLLVQTGKKLYRVDGRLVEELRGDYLMTEDVSRYYVATNQTVFQMRGEVQALLLDRKEDLYAYVPSSGRIPIQLSENEKFIGTFIDDMTYVFKGSFDTIYCYDQKNEWSGEGVYLGSTPLWVKGHNKDNFLFVSENKSLLQMYNGDGVLPLNILSKSFQKVYYGPDDDYYVVDQYGLVHVDKRGEELRVYDDESITNTLFDPSTHRLYFIDKAHTLYQVEDLEISLVDYDVSRVDLFRNSLFYLTEDQTLHQYEDNIKTHIAYNVDQVKSVAFNPRIFGAYNSVHLFYITQN